MGALHKWRMGLKEVMVELTRQLSKDWQVRASRTSNFAQSGSASRNSQVRPPILGTLMKTLNGLICLASARDSLRKLGRIWVFHSTSRDLFCADHSFVTHLRLMCRHSLSGSLM